MLTDEEATRVVGATLVSSDGEDVGEVESVLTHAADNRAAWALVAIEERRVLVPLDEAESSAGRLQVRYTAKQISAAPEASDDTIDSEQANELFEHYGIDDSVLRDDSGFATEKTREQGSSRDPRGGTGAEDSSQGHP